MEISKRHQTVKMTSVGILSIDKRRVGMYIFDIVFFRSIKTIENHEDRVAPASCKYDSWLGEGSVLEIIGRFRSFRIRDRDVLLMVW